jgi:hypothetical protein
MTEALDEISAAMENLQSQRSVLRDVTAKVAQLESDSHSALDPANIPARTEDNDVGPAAYALLQHITPSMDAHQTFGGPDLESYFEKLTSKSDERSRDHISQILQTSAHLAAARGANLERLSEALATNDTYALAIQELEDGIASMKAQIEASNNTR